MPPRTKTPTAATAAGGDDDDDDHDEGLAMASAMGYGLRYAVGTEDGRTEEVRGRRGRIGRNFLKRGRGERGDVPRSSCDEGDDDDDDGFPRGEIMK